MRCSTCGEGLQAGAETCPTCGAAVAHRLTRRGGGGRSDSGGVTVLDTREVRRVQECPRCGYHGHGVRYFSRTGHVGLLIGVSFFTYGLGGLAYWLARRKHFICPNCGLGWEHAGRAVSRGRGTNVTRDTEAPLPSGGTRRRVLGSMMVLLASFLIMMGIVEFEAAMVIVGSVIGAAGSGTFFWGWKALQERRQALTTGMQRRVLQLATRRGGTLTVTEVASDLNLSIPAAEKLLVGMDDGFRVRSEVTNEGILLFEFPEVLHRKDLGPGPDASV